MAKQNTLANWGLSELITINLKATAISWNQTQIAMSVFKNGRWTPFATHQKTESDPSNTGKLTGMYSFLEDYGRNDLDRAGTIHGVWGKPFGTNVWETINSLESMIGYNKENMNGNENAYPTPDGNGYEKLWLRTGGPNVGAKSYLYKGPVKFPPPFYNIPHPDSSLYNQSKNTILEQIKSLKNMLVE